MCFKLMSTPYSAYVTYSPSVHTVCTQKITDTERSTGEVFAAFLHAHCMLKRIWHVHAFSMENSNENMPKSKAAKAVCQKSFKMLLGIRTGSMI